MRRNRKHLLLTKEKLEEHIGDELDYLLQGNISSPDCNVDDPVHPVLNRMDDKCTQSEIIYNSMGHSSIIESEKEADYSFVCVEA